MKFATIFYSYAKFVFALIVIFSAVICLPAQTKKMAKKKTDYPERILIDKNKPSVYVEFVRFGKESPIYADDSEERVYLKFVNNSKWSIFANSFVYGDDEKTGLYYDVEKVGRLNPDEEIPMGYKRGDVGSPASEIKSGKSFNFSVPRNHLAEDLMIRIRFDFEWNYHWMNQDFYTEPYPMPEMSVVFLSSSLDNFLKEKSQKN